jgi:glycerol-3-phosphate acyltransferase PlsX
MGGDRAPDIVVAGVAFAHARNPDLSFLLYGDEQRIKPLVDLRPELISSVDIRHTPDYISNDMKPSHALRQGRNSSMRLAINAVTSGEASSVVSAGNTGALMAMSKFVFKTLPGIDRPAIASILPTQRGECVMLDLGANVECDAENLVQFALMGAIFCRAVLGKSNPTIGLLNIGEEELKGHDEIRAASAIIRERPLPGTFHGFVEGDSIAEGLVDVVVSDGFSGNIALKTAEGTAKLLAYFLKDSLKSSLLSKVGYLLARGALAEFKKKVDPRRYNGAMFLGLQGVCVKSHGGTDHLGFANALGVAFDLTEHHFNDRIRDELARHYGAFDSEAI